MHQSKKGNQWHFGMKAHIGVDADSGLVHTVRGTAGNVNDVVEGNSLLHGQEEFAFSDAGYQGVNKRPDARAHVGEAVEAGIVEDAIVAQSLDDAKSLWAYRESIGELLGRLKPFAAFDVGIPGPAMDGFVREVRLALAGRYPAGGHLFFGHIGDGNLHVLSGLHADPADLHDVEAAMYATTSRRRFDLGRAWGRLGQAPLPAPEPRLRSLRSCDL